MRCTSQLDTPPSPCPYRSARDSVCSHAPRSHSVSCCCFSLPPLSRSVATLLSLFRCSFFTENHTPLARIGATVVDAEGSHTCAETSEGSGADAPDAKLFGIAGAAALCDVRGCTLEASLPGAGPPLRALNLGGLLEEGGSWVPLWSTVSLRVATDTSGVSSFVSAMSSGGDEDGDGVSPFLWIVPSAPVRLLPSSARPHAAEGGAAAPLAGAAPAGALAVGDWYVALAATPVGKIPAMVRLSADGSGAATCTYYSATGDEVRSAERFEWCVVSAPVGAELPGAFNAAGNAAGGAAAGSAPQSAKSKAKKGSAVPHTMMTCHGTFVSVQPDGRTELRESAAQWEGVIVVELEVESGRRMIALRSAAHGQYLKVTPSGALRWTASKVGASETLEVVPTSIGWALKSNSGAYLSAMPNGSLRWTAHDVSAWETFVLRAL